MIRHVIRGARHTVLARMVLALAAVALGAASAGLATADGDTHSAPEPGSVRRLTEAQYRAAIADTFGDDIKIIGRFEPDLRVDGLIAVGTSVVSVTPGGLDQYEHLARGVAEQVTDAAHRNRLVGCAPGPADPSGVKCAATFFARVGRMLYRRPLTSAETAGLARLAIAGGRGLGNFDQSLATALAGMLTSPEFLFRMDRAAGHAVDGYSKAQRLSYLLWNAGPDDALLAAAGAGALDTPDGLAHTVDRMIAAPQFARGVRAFFSDFLALDDMDGLSKDPLLYPAFNASVAADLREQTLRTITDLLVTQRGDYRDLFTTRRIAMTRTLGPIYQVPVARDGWSVHEFPVGDPRSGLLSHASLLALHAHPGRTSPTLRGKAIRETLLCEKIPSPPANVNFAVVQDVNNATLRTTRARLAAHLDDEQCASCHKLTDPLGLGLENFDGAGQFRVAERGDVIDASGSFDQRRFDNAIGLGQIFHDSPKVAACLVATTWRYATGRNITAADAPVVAELDRRFAAQGYRVVDLMRAIAVEPAFYATSPTAGPDVVAARANRKDRS
ncbi:DUF1588 domain-containing protein [Novosphingobium sp.]|uniref:DUF1588 domain-containing protein n=1 Tax=Novosphingobium sp. TaxID=1874826 RepID=UPI003B51EE48